MTQKTAHSIITNWTPEKRQLRIQRNCLFAFTTQDGAPAWHGIDGSPDHTESYKSANIVFWPVALRAVPAGSASNGHRSCGSPDSTPGRTIDTAASCIPPDLVCFKQYQYTCSAASLLSYWGYIFVKSNNFCVPYAPHSSAGAIFLQRLAYKKPPHRCTILLVHGTCCSQKGGAHMRSRPLLCILMTPASSDAVPCNKPERQPVLPHLCGPGQTPAPALRYGA